MTIFDTQATLAGKQAIAASCILLDTEDEEQAIKVAFSASREAQATGENVFDAVHAAVTKWLEENF